MCSGGYARSPLPADVLHCGRDDARSTREESNIFALRTRPRRASRPADPRSCPGAGSHPRSKPGRSDVRAGAQSRSPSQAACANRVRMPGGGGGGAFRRRPRAARRAGANGGGDQVRAAKCTRRRPARRRAALPSVGGGPDGYAARARWAAAPAAAAELDLKAPPRVRPVLERPSTCSAVVRAPPRVGLLALRVQPVVRAAPRGLGDEEPRRFRLWRRIACPAEWPGAQRLLALASPAQRGSSCVAGCRGSEARRRCSVSDERLGARG